MPNVSILDDATRDSSYPSGQKTPGVLIYAYMFIYNLFAKIGFCQLGGVMATRLRLVVECLTPGCGAVLDVLTPMPVSSFIVHCPECGKTHQYAPSNVRELRPAKDGQPPN
jgi:hypothetical protein